MARVFIDNGPVDWPAVLVHGGAGGYARIANDPGLADRLEAGIGGALDAAWEPLQAGSALDAVVAAVRALEEDGNFNAGRGSVPTSDGSFEMDGSVMSSDGHVGAVAGIRAHSAVGAARAVAGEVGAAADTAARVKPGAGAQGAILLVGTGADDFAARWAVPELIPTASGRHGVADPEPLSADGTVGAVAVTADGRFAAATSTGGRSGQPPGRVGDTPIPGAGVWAQDGCAVSATGAGEAFILTGFSRSLAERNVAGRSLPESISLALEAVARFGGDGGGIALGADHTYVAGYDTRAMARGLRHLGGRRIVVLD
ncbi:MAG TPA: isoaspartyl peptidase/L-asparaginase [Acidimicrobiales bacterium]|nr:isoaspartyl peptidase/L-asparaginase [Acidimicrobiales bacterium]